MFFTAVWGHSKENDAITENMKDADTIIQYLTEFKRPTTIDSSKYAELIQDPLIKEMIYRYDATVNLTITSLKNKLFQDYEIIADRDTLKEKVQEWINEIGLINTNLHGDSILEKIFIDYLVYGECFAQIRYKNGEVEYIQRIEPTTMEVKKSPFDDRDVYFIQTANYEDLQGNAKSKTIYFVPPELRNKIKTNGAEVGKAENIIWFKRNGGSVIDKCIEYVLAKWDILRRMPTTIMRYSAPFIHGIVGKFDKDGNPMFPIPPADPNDEIAKKAYDEFKKQLMKLSEEFENWDERKELFTDPFLELKTIEAGNAINPQIYETSISILDKQISYALLTSMALIDARGSELATSRTVADYLNAAYRGMQTDFTALINFILFRKYGPGVKIRFADINPEDTNKKVERLDKQADIIKKLKDCGVKEDVIIEVMKEYGLEIEFKELSKTEPAQHSTNPNDVEDAIIEELTNKIMKNIEKATIAFNEKVEDFIKTHKSITVDNYEELNKELDEYFKDANDNIKSDINAAIDSVVAGTGLQIDVNSDAVKFAKNYTFDLCKKLTENQKNRLRDIIVSELNTVGDTNITQRIMDTLKTTKADAQRIVETELRRAKTWSENEYYKKYAEEHKDKYKVYVKIISKGDSKVCAQCKSYSGKEWEINEAPIIPPIHPRCRCTPVYRIEPIK